MFEARWVSTLAESWVCGHSLPAAPVTIRLDPLRTFRLGRRQRQVDDPDRQSVRPSRAHRDDRVIIAELELFHGHRDTEHLRLERYIQIVADDREPAGRLLALSVRVDRRLLDHLGELGRAERS